MDVSSEFEELERRLSALEEKVAENSEDNEACKVNMQGAVESLKEQMEVIGDVMRNQSHTNDSQHIALVVLTIWCFVLSTIMVVNHYVG